MAHELHIDTRTGRASMMYVGEEPWHGLGTRLAKPATAAEAIAAANLDWRVMKKPLCVNGPDEQPVPVNDKYAVVREDLWGEPECPVLGIVGSGYTPLQNAEAFSFFDSIVGKEAAIYHTAGALGGGERVWILARLPDSIRVIGDDICDKFLLLSNSHDGESSVQVKFTPVRVVCQNTLTMALSRGPAVRVAHTRNLHLRLHQAERLLGIIRERFNDIEGRFQEMVQVQMDEDPLRNYLRGVFPDPGDPDNDAAFARVETDRAWAEHFFREGAGNQNGKVAGTLWAAYNGVTEYADHRLGRSRDQRLNSVWFGDGYHRKARAYQLAVELLRALRN